MGALRPFVHVDIAALEYIFASCNYNDLEADNFLYVDLQSVSSLPHMIFIVFVQIIEKVQRKGHKHTQIIIHRVQSYACSFIMSQLYRQQLSSRCTMQPIYSYNGNWE